MHEMSLCESIIRIIEQQAKKERFSRVVKIRLALGEQAGASEESLAFCFPIVARQTIADGAIVEFIRTPDATLKVAEIEVK